MSPLYHSSEHFQYDESDREQKGNHIATHPDESERFHTVEIHKELKSAKDSLAAPFRNTPSLNSDNQEIRSMFLEDAMELAFPPKWGAICVRRRRESKRDRIR